MSELVEVAKVEEVPPGTARVVTAARRELALLNVDGSFYAVAVDAGVIKVSID